jgi:hypothetical protein
LSEVPSEATKKILVSAGPKFEFGNSKQLNWICFHWSLNWRFTLQIATIIRDVLELNAIALFQTIKLDLHSLVIKLEIYTPNRHDYP